MRRAHSLATVADVSPDPFDDLRRNIDPEWVVQALEATERPPCAAAGCQPSKSSGWSSRRPLRRAASSRRARLGPEPMEWPFTICAEHWAHASARNHSWRGLALYGVDGTTLRVPDSTDNAGYFGYSHSVRGESAYPMVRGVGLMALRSHLLAAVAFGPYAAGEIVEPTRISFVAALRLICDEWLWCALASLGAIPKHLRNLRTSLKTLILPPRRSERRFPRAVMIKMSNYARKRCKGSK